MPGRRRKVRKQKKLEQQRAGLTQAQAQCGQSVRVSDAVEAVVCVAVCGGAGDGAFVAGDGTVVAGYEQFGVGCAGVPMHVRGVALNESGRADDGAEWAAQVL